MQLQSKYGHHDENFPLKKNNNEFRGIIIGDSITMGHGVTNGEAFPNQLEHILKKRLTIMKPSKLLMLEFKDTQPTKNIIY